MENSDPQGTWKNHAGAPPALFAGLGGALLVALCVTSALLFDESAAPAGLFVIIVALGLRGMLLHYPHGALGLCNSVTLTRAAVVALLTGAILNPLSAEWAVFMMATLALALDGLDGWLARRSGLSSAFGARFDMEVDALLGAVLALILLARGHVGPEVLILGFTRYIFVACSWLVPRLRAPLPQSLRRKAVCVIQIATLIALLCPLMPVWLMYPLSLVGAALLLWSFATDTNWLLRRD